MTPAEIDSLIARWMAVELEKTEELRDTVHHNADDRDFMVGLVADQYEDAAYTNARNPGYLAPEADALLQAAGLPPLDHDTRGFKRLCRKLQIAKLEVLGIEVERWQGVYKTSPVNQGDVVPVAKSNGASSLLFSVVAQKYLEETPRSKRTKPQVVVEYGKFLEAIGGDRPIGTIVKADIRGYKETLLTTRKLALRTTGKHLRTLSGVFTWAEKQGYLPEGQRNPVRGLAPSDAESVKDAQQILPFSSDQLLRVFSSPNFLKQRHTHPARYWITLLCLFTLCRREEVAQLAMVDLGEEHGIPFIVITDLGEDQSTKNRGSKRRIPIHSSLIALGFLDLIATARRRKQARLFQQLPRGRNGYSDAIGKWFGRHLDKVGLSQPELVMHSLRHGIHYLHALGCPSDLAEMLTGHTASTVHNGYEHRELTTMARLQAGLEKMQFPEVLKALKEGMK